MNVSGMSYSLQLHKKASRLLLCPLGIIANYTPPFRHPNTHTISWLGSISATHKNPTKYSHAANLHRRQAVTSAMKPKVHSQPISCSPAQPPSAFQIFTGASLPLLSCSAKILHCANWHVHAFTIRAILWHSQENRYACFPFWRAGTMTAKKICNHFC